ncbi:histidine phosphatase family protein [Jiangella rhizosphaerae]|uniref:Histidine phosphatase family protein n=1 Tax=Jiangella rhizosphaerae TaxID=2293569 RepID=A0A418KKR5_9ACTN|nr:histidine phosphatase family protein [Jiangella rhizosphaerae]RIQ17858.1 histidine phosphatase family protein [Jiangella rhizosphaerae]
MSTLVTLARHGRTPWHEGNRYTGSSDIGIDDVGRRQAAALAAWAARTGPDALYASGLLRSRQTAEAVAVATGLAVAVDDRLGELDFGAAEGRTLGELRSADPDVVARFLADPVDHHLPGGEHPERAADRAEVALREIAARHPDGHVLVVAHNTIIRLVVCRFLGVPLRMYRTALRGMEPTATTALTFDADGGVMLEHYNREATGDD